MKNKVLSTALILFALLAHTAYAANSQLLTKIGALDLGGNMYSEWWYSGENPTLSGTVASSAGVTVTIGDDGNEVTADSSGAWSYTPTTLTTGDHLVSITSGSDTYAFTLHAGQNFTTVSETTVAVPSTGSNTLAGILIGTSSLLVATYMTLIGPRKTALKRFERDISNAKR